MISMIADDLFEQIVGIYDGPKQQTIIIKQTNITIHSYKHL